MISDKKLQRIREGKPQIAFVYKVNGYQRVLILNYWCKNEKKIQNEQT